MVIDIWYMFTILLVWVGETWKSRRNWKGWWIFFIPSTTRTLECLRRCSGFMWPFTEKNQGRARNKGEEVPTSLIYILITVFVLIHFDTMWYVLIFVDPFFCSVFHDWTKTQNSFFFPGKCELHSLRGKVEVWVALSNLGLLPHLDQAVCRRRSRGEGQLQC